MTAHSEALLVHNEADYFIFVLQNVHQVHFHSVSTDYEYKGGVYLK